jgi:hypothetical protein
MNTLKYAKKLEEVGFSREQAEMTIGILNEVVESNLATKQDLKDLSVEMSQEFKAVRFEMQQLKSDLVIKLGAMMVTGIALISALIKLF